MAVFAGVHGGAACILKPYTHSCIEVFKCPYPAALDHCDEDTHFSKSKARHRVQGPAADVAFMAMSSASPDDAWRHLKMPAKADHSDA